MVFSVTYTICKGLELDAQGLKVSRSLIANILLFNISNFIRWEVIYIMVCSLAHWGTWDDSLVFWYIGGGDILSTKLMASVMYLHFNIQEEDILKHINAKCHLSALSVNL
jgi:hypothetical protein